MSDPIRVGIIRCDTHGMWYGALIDDHDPVLLQRPVPFDQPAPYSWHRGLIHYYYYSHYREPLEMTAPRVHGFTITRCWDEDARSAELFSRVFHGRPRVCRSFEEVSDDVDLVLIADCNGDGSDHLMLAEPGLRKGVATFLDKPMAFTTADVVKLVQMAREHRAPLTSLSILQTDPRAVQFARRLPECGKLSLGTVICPAFHLAGMIHAISTTHHAFGTGIERVTVMTVPQKHTVIHLDYGQREDRPVEGVVLNSSPDDNPFRTSTRFSRCFAAAYGAESAIQGIVLDGFSAAEGAAAIMELVRDTVRTRRPHPLTADMVKAVAVAEAARKSAASGGRTVAVEYPDLDWTELYGTEAKP